LIFHTLLIFIALFLPLKKIVSSSPLSANKLTNSNQKLIDYARKKKINTGTDL
jgi:hypothetical protein